MELRLLAVALVVAACATTPGTDTSTDGTGDDGKSDGYGAGLDRAQKRVAEELTSIWENDTPALDYAYSENIGDGRGYTSGRAGFCTGTGDAIEVVACFDLKRSAAQGNRMAKYMPALQTINARFEATGEDQAGTAELDTIGNWNTDWAASANDDVTRADFRACEDAVVDRLYYGPAMQAAHKWGLKTALARAAVYDMWINQGDDELIRKANTALGDKTQVAPVIGYRGITEDAWLKQFLIARRDLMWADATWKQAIDRVAGYEKQRRLGNWDLSHAIRNDVRAHDCWGGTYVSSGYTVREIAPDGAWTTPTSSSYGCD